MAFFEELIFTHISCEYNNILKKSLICLMNTLCCSVTGNIINTLFLICWDRMSWMEGIWLSDTTRLDRSFERTKIVLGTLYQIM